MRPARHLLIPNANNPQLLQDLLELVGRGLRSPRALAEALGVEARTVDYYTQAAEWLGLLMVDDACHLTPLGLELVYAGEDRARVYARAVYANPFIAELLAGTGDALPEVEAIAAAVARADPTMAASTVRRRASSIRSLIAPALGTRRVRPPDEGRQIPLPLGLPVTPSSRPRLDAVGGRSYSPEAYRYLLAALLDHGELQLRHVRGLLDRAGADRAPIGGYVDMAIARGDAVRDASVVGVAAAAVARRELVDSTAGVMLSDPRYRAYLEDCRLAASDRLAARRRAELGSRFRAWDERLFGRPVDPATLDADLATIVLERPVHSFPLAVPADEPAGPPPGAFLDRWTAQGVRVACPPTLVQLQGGLATVNRLLGELRRHPEQVRPRNVVDPHSRVHAAILAPGEAPPRAVPDTRSLRVRVLSNVPYIAMLAALLLLHRMRPDRAVVVRVRGRWRVRYGGVDRGPVLELLDRFGRERGWVVSRRATGGLPDAALFDALEALGIATVVGGQAVLAERFFGLLRRAPEESELHPRLASLADALGASLEAAL